MSKRLKFKFLAAVIAVMLCFSVYSLSAYAVGEGDDSGYEDDSSYVESGEDDIVSAPSDDVSSDAGNDDYSSSYDDGYPDVDDYSSDNDYNYSYDSSYDDYNYDYNYDYNDSHDDYNDSYDYNDYNNYGYSSYVGGGQTYVVPDSTAPSAALYDIRDGIDSNELNSSDWSDIAAILKNANSADDGGDDFSFIKNNNSSSDNGDWMLYIGIACIVLSIAGIVYVVLSYVKNRRNVSSGKRTSGTVRMAAATAGASSASGRYRSGSDYGDGYRRQSAKKKNKSSKYDTADVKLPKSSRTSNHKNGGGKRYK